MSFPSHNPTTRQQEPPPDTSPGPYTGGPIQTTGIFSDQPLMQVQGDRLVIKEPAAASTAATSGPARVPLPDNTRQGGGWEGVSGGMGDSSGTTRSAATLPTRDS